MMQQVNEERERVREHVDRMGDASVETIAYAVAEAMCDEEMAADRLDHSELELAFAEYQRMAREEVDRR